MDWVYARAPADAASSNDQRTTWAHYPTCINGRRQSPIDIATTAAVAGGVEPMAPHLRPLDRLLLVNTGRSFQVHEQGSAVRVLPAGATPATAPVENGSASKGYTVLNGRRYDFYQVHWHTPSEHLVDGRHAALEVPLTRLAGLSLSADTNRWSPPPQAHFVHRDASESGLAVITVLYDEAAACDPLLSAFWDDFPPSDGARRYAESAASVDFGAMLSELLLRGGGAYQWEGSLTTPPCTEGVEWRLIKARRHVCAAQLERLRAALGAASGVRANNRMVQPLNGRLLRASALSPPAAPFPLWGAAAVGGVLALALAAALAFAARRGRGGARRSRAGLLQARGPSTGEKELSSALPSAGSRTPAVPGAASAGGHADDSGLRNSSSSSDSFVSEDADSAGELLAREKV